MTSEQLYALLAGLVVGMVMGPAFGIYIAASLEFKDWLWLFRD